MFDEGLVVIELLANSGAMLEELAWVIQKKYLIQLPAAVVEYQASTYRAENIAADDVVRASNLTLREVKSRRSKYSGEGSERSNDGENLHGCGDPQGWGGGYKQSQRAFIPFSSYSFQN